MGGFLAKFGKKEHRILLQGLDAAGKTTILYQLKLGEVVTTIPTIGFNVETVEYKRINFTAWDIGGRDKMRPLFRHYYPNTSAVVFVVDSNDVERIDEVKDFVHLTMADDELRGVPLLIYANKQDLGNAMTPERVIKLLDLHKLRNTTWHVIPTVATTGDGLYEGLDWLAENFSNKDKSLQIKADSQHSSHTILDKTWEVFKSIFIA